MDFTPWSPTHALLVLFAIVAFIGQVAIMFYRIGQNGKKIDQLSVDLQQAIKEQGETFCHAIERLGDRLDKRLSDMQSEMNQRLSDMQSEMNQRFLEVHTEICSGRSDMNQQIGSVREEPSKLNQNHIDHLSYP